ncbi:dynactin subunit 4 [Myxozyma melibiosi]|uniref:Dynactin subunit 4 n=1 Tax=Myxozyma melibiosi TaxID=54550 RepID=A0ABR1F9N6_9ASCO
MPSYPSLRIHCPCAEPADEADAFEQPADDATKLSTDLSSSAGNALTLPPTLTSPLALHLLDSLYFCHFCKALRCERCVVEEIVQAFCPTCLHIYPDTRKTANVYCTRNCLQCPLCFTALVMFAKADDEIYMQCPHCAWDSRSSGEVVFRKTTSLYTQLRALSLSSSANDDGSVFTADDGDEEEEEEPAKTSGSKPISAAAQFDALTALYRDIYSTDSPSASIKSSPLLPGRSVARSLETTKFLKSYYRSQSPTPSSPSPRVNPDTVLNALGRAGSVSREKAAASERRMREQLVLELDQDEEEAEIARMQGLSSLAQTVSLAQRRAQPVECAAVSTPSRLRPLPTKLRTRRSKRCRACRHILVRPEVTSTVKGGGGSKSVTTPTLSTSFRISLLSRNYIPTIRATHLAGAGAAAGSSPYKSGFVPHTTYTFALTVFNPLVEPIKATMASPPQTPRGRHSVTLLAPSFDVGGNADEEDWDLQAILDLRMRFAAYRTGGGGMGPGLVSGGGVFARGRNWTSVFVEVVPAEAEGEIEIPLFVSVEYEIDAEKEEGEGRGQKEKEKQEMAFWSVLKLGMCRGRAI